MKQDDPNSPDARAGGADGNPVSRRLRVAMYCLLGLVTLLIAMIVVVEGARFCRSLIAQPKPAPRPTTIDGWIEQLRQGTSDEARKEAAGMIVKEGPEAVARALDASAMVANDASMLSTSKPAIRALAGVGPPAAEPLGKALASKKQNVRAAAADVLRTMGAEAKEAVGPLTEALDDENRWVRWYSVEALGKIGPEAASAVDSLIPLAEHEDRHTRQRAVVALGRIGPAAKDAVPLLKRIQRDDKHLAIRKAAGAALYQIDLAEIAAEQTATATDDIRALIEKVRGGDPFEGVAAAKELGRRGPEAAAAIPTLAQALQHEDKWIREAAADALGGMGRRAKSVIPALQRATADKEPEVRQAAEKALEKIDNRRPGGTEF